MSIEMQMAMDGDMAVINDDGTKEYVENQPEPEFIEAEVVEVVENQPADAQAALFGK